MDTWNAIITVRGDRLRQARKALRALGHVERTGFYNVLAMKVDEPKGFLDGLERLVAEHPGRRRVCRVRLSRRAVLRFFKPGGIRVEGSRSGARVGASTGGQNIPRAGPSPRSEANVGESG